MRRMLMIYPNNFLQGAMGTNNRVAELVRIFREIGFEIDYFSYENFSPDSTFKDFEGQNKNNIIHKLFLYDFQKGYEKENAEKEEQRRLKNRIVRKVKRMIHQEGKKQYLSDWVPSGAQYFFTDILKDNQYDVIITFYTYLATLFKDRDISAKKVYFMEDSMFLQQYSWDKDKVEGISLGKLMDEEIERLKWFDEIFCISNDERIFYEKITGKSMHFFPHLISQSSSKIENPMQVKRWDVYFIGFNNPFNVEGLTWFLEEVYPFLDKTLKIVLVGSATKSIDVKYSNVEIIPFAPDLEEIYSNSKVAICPMFRGTGMKVKVVEAMERGFPIVCNERGVDGLPDKTMCGCLVTQDAKCFAEYINKLIADKRYYDGVAEQVRSYYKRIFDREKYVEELRKILKE